MEVRVVYWRQYPRELFLRVRLGNISCALSGRTAGVSTIGSLAGERSRRQFRFPDRLVQFQ
jgi:hypothetical protein